MKILGIESSCDETGVAIIDQSGQILAERLYSQVELHADYGGVVPELASRDHVRKCLPLIKACLQDAELTIKDLDAVAYTAGPGLVGALFVGASIGESLAWALGVPSIPIHHMEAHLLVPFLEASQNSSDSLKFPFLSLLVSGGHTLIVHARALGDYQVLGQSRDDAVGEAFDKVSKHMGLGYPGGPIIEKLAALAEDKVMRYPRSLLEADSLDFSFSGLKTHTLLSYQKSTKTLQDQTETAYAFQSAIVDTLYEKCARAFQQTGLNTLVIAGGVSANQALRDRFTAFNDEGKHILFPPLKVCTDNGVMVAYAGLLHAIEKRTLEAKQVRVYPRWPLDKARASVSNNC